MTQPVLPAFNSREMKCMMCGRTMFYSAENLVHVCLETDHGILCYFEPDSCWFAASEKTAMELGKKGVKFHFIPQSVFENGGLGTTFKCDYAEEDKSS
ncbi:MAG: hypothetical protein JRN15_21270 [Nitrososphaerota archaeon]|nr:hypothetical protein [Nitrososphaerota archaeon]